MGISVSGGDVNYGTKTHLFSGDVQGVGLPLPLLLYRPVPWPGRLGGEPVGRKSGDGSAGKRSSIREMLARIQQQRWINVADMEITEIPCEEERGFR